MARVARVGVVLVMARLTHFCGGCPMATLRRPLRSPQMVRRCARREARGGGAECPHRAPQQARPEGARAPEPWAEAREAGLRQRVRARERRAAGTATLECVGARSSMVAEAATPKATMAIADRRGAPGGVVTVSLTTPRGVFRPLLVGSSDGTFGGISVSTRVMPEVIVTTSSPSVGHAASSARAKARTLSKRAAASHERARRITDSTAGGTEGTRSRSDGKGSPLETRTAITSGSVSR